MALLSLLLGSCKKEETTVPKSKTELLCAHYWITTAVTVDPPFDDNGTPFTDIFSLFEDCQKDDLYKFNTDKTTIIDEGASKCDPLAPQTINGTWSFDANETVLTIENDPAFLKELTESTLKVFINDTIDGVDYTYTYTFKKH